MEKPIFVQAEERGGRRRTGSLTIEELLERVSALIPVERVFFEIEGADGTIRLQEGGYLRLEFVPAGPLGERAGGSAEKPGVVGYGESQPPVLSQGGVVASPVSQTPLEAVIANYDPFPVKSISEPRVEPREAPRAPSGPLKGNVPQPPPGSIQMDGVIPATEEQRKKFSLFRFK